MLQQFLILIILQQDYNNNTIPPIPRGFFMDLRNWINKSLPNVIDSLEDSLNKNYGANTTEELNLATRSAVYDVLDELLATLFPGLQTYRPIPKNEMNLFIGDRLRSATLKLGKQVEQAIKYRCAQERCDDCDCEKSALETTIYVISSLPDLHKTLVSDVQAAYDGDPAAKSVDEIIMSYPCVEAIATYRIAHLLYEKSVAIIPRIMTERAHSRTGIDIHPGAQIGPGFFIDHGTGVVIGETAVIGKNVRLYQGVTLGALSFPKDKDGKLIKNLRRHPKIEDNVIIYSEATILGNITVGANSVIGGNVFVSNDVPPNSKIYNRQPSPLNDGGLG